MSRPVQQDLRSGPAGVRSAERDAQLFFELEEDSDSDLCDEDATEIEWQAA